MDRRILALVALAACRPSAPRTQYVSEWATLPYEVARSAGRPAIEATRANAYVAVAIHEAFVAEQGSPLRSLGGQLNGLWMVPFPPAEGVDGVIAGAEASRLILDSILPASPRPDSLAGAQQALRRRERVSDVVSRRSIEHGRSIASAILAWSRTDGFATQLRRAQLAKPPREMNDADWGTLRTFVLRNSDECAAPPAPAYSVRANSEFFVMAKALSDSTRSATPAGTASALYWVNDTSGRAASATWTRVLASSAAGRPSAPLAAEALMLAALAIADAELASRRQRAREGVAPPAAYLKRTVDANWMPTLVTGELAYPFSAAVVSAAAVEASTNLLGDSLSFADSTGPSGPTSVYSMSRARDEAATAGSRLGVTFPLAEQVGKEQGRCIGGRVTGRLRSRL